MTMQTGSKKIVSDLKKHKAERKASKKMQDHLRAAELDEVDFDNWLFEQYQAANAIIEKNNMGAQ